MAHTHSLLQVANTHPHHPFLHPALCPPCSVASASPLAQALHCPPPPPCRPPCRAWGQAIEVHIAPPCPPCPCPHVRLLFLLLKIAAGAGGAQHSRNRPYVNDLKESGQVSLHDLAKRIWTRNCVGGLLVWSCSRHWHESAKALRRGLTASGHRQLVSAKPPGLAQICCQAHSRSRARVDDCIGIASGDYWWRFPFSSSLNEHFFVIHSYIWLGAWPVPVTVKQVCHIPDAHLGSGKLVAASTSTPPSPSSSTSPSSAYLQCKAVGGG